MMRDGLRDVRHALRLMAKAPAFTLLSVLTLGLGVGANTAIFSVVNALLLRPLPYPAPERLAFIDGAFERPEGVTAFQLSYPELTDLVTSARSFSTIAPWSTGYGLALEGTEGAARLQANFVGRSYFDLLGAQPAVGRGFAPDDHTYGDDGRMVVIISDGVWRQHFATDPAIVGREIRLQGRPFTVVGVMPSSFDDAALAYTERVDVWVPLERASTLVGVDLTNRGGRMMWGFARLADGVAWAEAQAELATIGQRMASAYPATNAAFTVRAVPLSESFFRDARRPLWLLLGGSWFVLLIGCANVANLLLVRSTGRTQEFAVRLAIGASRMRVVQQLLVESVVLAVAGAIAGLLLAVWMTPALVAASGFSAPGFAAVGLDRTVLGVAFATATACGLLFGLAPIWRVLRTSLRDGVGLAGARAAGRSRTALWLAGIETTAAFVLAAGALLMLQSFAALTRTDLAFPSERLLTVRLELPQQRYSTPAARVRFADQVRQHVASLPGVTAAIVWGPSMFARSTWISFVAPDDRVVPDHERVMLWRHSTNPGGLADLGVPLLAGRDFADTDTLDTPAVAILSEAAARRLWPGLDPVGRRLRSGSGATATVATVIGVAADARHRGRFRFSDGAAAHEPQMDVYLPYAQRPNALLTLGIRTAGMPAAATQMVASAVASIDPTLPLYDIAPLDDRLRREASSVGFAALLLNLYGALALLLAAIGVYGVLSAGVAARLKELGIRAALGAEPRRLQRAILRQGLLVASGAAIAGTAIAMLAATSTQALLFEARAADPRVLASAAVLLLVVAAVASLVPARRASRVELLSVLKND